jgi:hypothetical protein
MDAMMDTGFSSAGNASKWIGFSLERLIWGN